MGDTESNCQPSKKRAAGVQLSRENPGLDDSEETSENETGTFKKAPEEVLATRRIVKVRRQQTSTAAASASDPPSAPNPFASIQLVTPASSAPNPFAAITFSRPAPLVEVEAPKSDETEKQVDEIKSENKVDDESKGEESTAGEEKTDQSIADKDGTDDVSKVSDEVAEDGASSDAAKKATEETEDKEEKESSEKNAEAAPLNSFQQLSSGLNAFSGVAGTGFSSGSFSFGSITKDKSPVGSTTGSLFGFGASNNGSSSFFGGASGGASIVGKSEGSKIPAMQEFIDGGWKERGKGELKVNVSSVGTGKARLVMRARGNFRLILNASIFPDMKLTNMDKKGVTFACVNSAGEGKEGLSTIALKFKDVSIVEDFKAAVVQNKGQATVALKTPENSPKADDEEK
ncbi:hypothetical protein MIMGU_mgv1a007635mg [Erythranthe guttata]|uniref:RanBD1 domain-containing protein n=1 Tax=Erythranthe guttata TaxID=4155 RepID=A0A022Q4X1_ERYGU|nr:hypothetical protein MIMGU_mgv1a007635mg [Erythranthe guttata]